MEYQERNKEIIRTSVDILYGCVAQVSGDPTTYDLMKAYLADEEEDLYWDEEQLDLIKLIGEQNWLIKQM